VASGEKIRELTTHETTVESIVFSPDGTRIATGSRYEDIKVCSIEGVVELRIENGARNESLSFSADGRKLLITFREDKGDRYWNFLRVLDMEADEVALVLNSSTSFTCGTFVGNVPWIVAGERYDNRVSIFHADTGQPIRSLPQHRDQVNAVAACASSSDVAIAAAHNDGVVRYWRLIPGRENLLSRSIKAHDDVATYVKFIDPWRLASCGADGTVKVWDLGQSDRAKSLGQAERFDTQDLAFAPDGQQLAVAYVNGLWLEDMAKEVGRNIRQIEDQPELSKVAFSPRGDRLATCSSSSNRITLWDTTGPKVAGYLTHEEGFVKDIDFSPDGRRLASAGVDRAVHVWDVDELREVDRFDLPDQVGAVAYSPSGRYLVSGGRFPEIIVFDTAQGQIRMRLKATSTTEDLAFSPDGHLLASAHADSRIRFWEAESGRLLAVLRGHEDMVLSLAFSVDGKTLASTSDDGTVRLWSVGMRCEFGIVERRLYEARTVTFAPDGRGLVAGFYDTPAVLRWEIDDPQWKPSQRLLVPAHNP
jgi:WD40 repeat protein